MWLRLVGVNRSSPGPTSLYYVIHIVMTRFTVWAPAARTVELDLSGKRPALHTTEAGWWAVEVTEAGTGTDDA